MNTNEPDIQSRDYWFKIIEMLQHNWALIDPKADGGVTVYFVGDTSGVFDQIDFADADTAVDALKRNGFRRLADDAHAQSFIRPPQSPFRLQPHPNGPIYSSGRFWE